LGRDNFQINYERPEDDVKAIIKFLHDLQSQLEEFIEKYEIINPQRNEFYEDFSKAWKDVKLNFPKVEKYLKSSNDVRNRLEDEGLTGNQLTLKLNVYYFAVNKIKKAEDDYYTERSYRPQRRSRLRRFWGWALEVADIILGSLGDAGVPFVGAISEFKDVTEKVTKEPKR